MIGNREVNTTDPGYYKWTQWIFLKLYNSWFDPETKAARPIEELMAARNLEFPDESPRNAVPSWMDIAWPMSRKLR